LIPGFDRVYIVHCKLGRVALCSHM